MISANDPTQEINKLSWIKPRKLSRIAIYNRCNDKRPNNKHNVYMN